jgi:DNA polymerase elongation subunit (family B)
MKKYKQYSFVHELNIHPKRGREAPKDRKLVHMFYDETGKKHCHVWGLTKHNKKVIPDYRPYVGVKPSKPRAQGKRTDMHGNFLEGGRTENLEDYYFKIKKDETLNEFQEVEKVDSEGKIYNIDELVASRVYGEIKPQFQFIADHYPGEIDYDLSMLHTWIVDIEVDSEGGYPDVDDPKKVITSITIKDLKRDQFFVLALKPWDKNKSVHKGTIDLKKITFKLCEPISRIEGDEDQTIMKEFKRLMRRIKPDVMVGFYSKNFDFPYLIGRAEHHGIDNKFVPYKDFDNYGYCFNGTPKMKQGRKERYPFIGGVQLLDYQMMYKKFIFTPREMYSLDYIASQELGETKLDYSEHDNLAALWREDPQLYIDYNIYDVELVHLLDQKLGLLDLTYTIAYFAKCNFNDVMGTVQPWDTIMHNELADRKMLSPPNIRKSKEQYPGAYVLPSPIGVQDWLFSVDLASLYPHVQQQYNISPETILDLEVDVDQEAIDDRFFNKQIDFDRQYILSASGNYFRKDKEGIIPQVLKGIYTNRKVAKNKMLKLMDEREIWKKENGIDVKTEFVDFPEGDLKDQWAELNKPISTLNNYQMAMKILMNSEYGALANRWFRYYDIRLARAVTLGGQLALKWAKEKLEQHPNAKKYKYRVVYGDTDSLYVSCEYVVEQIRLRNPDATDAEVVDQVVKFIKKKVQPIIDEGYEDLAEYMNANENRMFMETEKIITNALFSTKKRYAMNVLWDEGVTYPEPKLKVKGFEIVRSSTPKVIRDALKKAVSILLVDEEKLREYVKEQKRLFKGFNPEQVAFPRSANNIAKYQKVDALGDPIWDYKRKIFNPEKKTTSGTPIGVKAAIIYNRYVTDKNLGFPLVISGEKIKFIYLRQPNDIDEKVIGFIRKMPDGLKKYVDWNLQFEKTFLSPIHRIYENMGKVFTLQKETNILELF